MSARPVPRLVAAASAIAALGVAHAAAATTFSFFQLPPIVLPDSHFPTMAVAADLDGSGLPDVVVPGRNLAGLVRVMRNVGGGVLEIHQTLEIGAQTDWAALGDLDGNGQPDLVLALRNGPRGLMVRHGLGDGTFTTVGQHLPDGREMACVVLADLNNDGSLDAAAVDYNAGTLRVYRNDGSGTLVPDSTIRLIPHSGGFVSAPDIVAADLDGDGATDLLVTATGGGRVIKLRNLGDATFEPAINRRFAPVENYQPGLINTIPADMNGDGKLDLVSPWIMGFLTQLIGILPNEGDLTFGEPVLNTGVFGSVTFRGAVADLDGDGKPDVMVGHALAGVLGVNRNLGNYTLAPPQTIPIGTFVRHIQPIDMTGDGVIDLILCDAPNHILHVLVNQTPQAEGGVAGADAPAGPAVADGGRAATDPLSQRLRRDLRSDIDLDSSHDGRDLGLWLQERQ